MFLVSSIPLYIFFPPQAFSIFNHCHLAVSWMIYTPISVNYTLSGCVFHIYTNIRIIHFGGWLQRLCQKKISFVLFLTPNTIIYTYIPTRKYIHFNMYFECYCCYYYKLQLYKFYVLGVFAFLFHFFHSSDIVFVIS